MLHQFNYLAPKTRAELHGILAGDGADASLLAGGTDLLVNIRAGLTKPALVIDAKKVEGFSGISWSEREGSGHPADDHHQRRSARHEDVQDFPLLVGCARDLASHQIRNRATVIGNVVNASPCSDMAPALLCLGAKA